ncbi:DUF3231 family protein [Virgibacillus salinus]|uniref:DUF3231 family protein n=1 Tax=Virgibacillus salinus TaxID=553311 RepID=A0A1H0XTP0_9BACI|nr:DUF3231 family protein [Virgibacillus salinus]SDQ06225.1 Protein of unknown function [Virgibacillus salinus]
MDNQTKSEKTPHIAKLTAPEIANLWSQYQNDTMAICIYKYMLENVEDESIRSVLKLSLSLAEGHIPIIKDYFKNENFPIPHGFTGDDVDLTAPRLFEDTICLTYTYVMSVNGLAGYAAALTTNVRRDIRDYFVDCQNETMELFNNSLDLLLEKGIVSRPPTISPANSFNFIEKQAFMKGLLGGERPLSCIEISHLFWDLKKIELSKSFTMAFSQVAKSEEVKKFLWRGSEIYTKHSEILQSVLSLEQLPFPKANSSEITNSTTAPFSDRLMMYHKSLFGSTTIGFYGTAIGTSQRADLVVHYTRLASEMGKYMEDGMNITIKNKWMEEPPLTEDRKKLSRKQY